MIDSMMMPAGKYYVGDLCYVMDDEWDEVCQGFFAGRTDQGCNEGVFCLADGRRYASFNTKWGDGEYEDDMGNRYGVDAGLIGCIRLDDINHGSSANHIDGGQVFDFPQDFIVRKDGGVLVFGHVTIDTDPAEADYDEY